jgi:hypothetical protein
MVPIGGRVLKRGKVQRRKAQKRGKVWRGSRVSKNHHNPGDPCLYRLRNHSPLLRPPILFSKRRMRLRVYPDRTYQSRLVMKVKHRPLELLSKVNHHSYRLSNLPPKVYPSHFKPSLPPRERISPIFKVWHPSLHLDPSSPIQVSLQYPDPVRNPSCWHDVDLLVHPDQGCRCYPNYARIGTSPIQQVSSLST